MPQTVEKSFAYSELSDKAKQRARQGWVERADHLSYGWWDTSFDEFMTCGLLLGITIDTESVRTHGGSKDRPNISFSGFSSQGDGASFVGSYRIEPRAVAMIAEHAPQDEELNKLAAELTALQVAMALEHGGGVFGCGIVCSGKGCASHNMDTAEAFLRQPDTTYDWFDDDIVLMFRALFRRFADWMYDYLEAEYDYLHSDDFLAEEMAEETFDEDGSII